LSSRAGIAVIAEPCEMEFIPAQKIRRSRKDCFGATPKPARETRALPFRRELGRGDHAGRDEP